jgi:hypothetical protein
MARKSARPPLEAGEAGADLSSVRENVTTVSIDKSPGHALEKLFDRGS